MMKHPLIFLAFMLFLISCEESTGTKPIDLGTFSLQLPEHWQHFPRQGYDSQVGVITNGKDELVYDYGWYSYDFSHQTDETHIRTHTTINDKPSLIVQPKNKGEGIIGLFVEVDEQTRFSLYGEDIRDEETILQIFHSVRFEE